ncbi:MAG: MoaD/ThiS family protein [Chloroflexi bacterium]|nr:MoaD/ThiS family protein [Chloroflexota bacterium]
MQCRIELYGVPRLLAGEPVVQVDLLSGQTVADVVPALAVRCPALVGRVIRPELDGLLDGYLFNRDGRAFVQRLDEPLAPREILLLLSSAAGG